MCNVLRNTSPITHHTSPISFASILQRGYTLDMLIGVDGSRAFIQDRTGTENYSYELLVHLAKIDSKNNYLIYLRYGNKVDKSEWPDNFKFVRSNFKYLWTQVWLSYRTFGDDLDLLFVPAHTLPLIRKPGLKTVMTVHDLGAEYLPQMHQLKQILYLGLMTHYQLKTASKIIAVSKATKIDLINKLGLPEKSIDVVYEGYDAGWHNNVVSNNKTGDILSNYDIKRYYYFIFVGTIQPRKNLLKVIEAYYQVFGNFANAPKLILVGSKGWLADDIYDLVKKLNLQSQVKFLGRVDEEQLKTLYQNAIALVFPSLFEGFGLPILEAFANSCPVITSNISSMPEVAGEAAILVDPYKVEDIAKAMDRLLVKESSHSKTVNFQINRSERDRLIHLGRKQLIKFSWEKCAQETLKVFEEVSKK